MNEFEAARIAGLAHLQERQGIGTLQERSLHSILKYWIDPDETHHEKSLGLGRLVADVFDGERVTEIQTRSFSSLKKKLEVLLPLYPVTIVFPIAHTKKLIWVNPETGEATAPRKSPKTGTVWDAFPELSCIRNLLLDSRLTIRLVLLDMEEYKLLNGWSKDKKKGACRMERIPYELIKVVDLQKPKDFTDLIPDNIQSVFRVSDLSNCLSINRRKAGTVANVLYNIHAIQRIGKDKNAYLYQRSK